MRSPGGVLALPRFGPTSCAALILRNCPPPCPLNAVVHSQKAFDGYSVPERLLRGTTWLSRDGNPYLPAELGDSMPGILLPHGHLENGRRHASTQFLAASLARMGGAAFAWDMLGFGESTEREHKHPQPADPNLFQHAGSRLPDVATGRRCAPTGSHRCFRRRNAIIYPCGDRRSHRRCGTVVQVSAHFNGGCVCESGMPIHVHDDFETNNVEIAASFAPKPLLLVSDGGDWTANTPKVEFPYIQRIYGLLDAEDRVENAHFADEGHDYGPSKRAAVTKFFAKYSGPHLAAVQNASGEIDESFVRVLDFDELAAFDEAHRPPSHALHNGDEMPLRSTT